MSPRGEKVPGACINLRNGEASTRLCIREQGAWAASREDLSIIGLNIASFSRSPIRAGFTYREEKRSTPRAVSAQRDLAAR